MPATIGLFLCLAAIAITPIIIGLVFGSPFKMSLRQGLVLTDRTFLLFFLRPMADELFALTAMMLERDRFRRKRSRRLRRRRRIGLAGSGR